MDTHWSQRSLRCDFILLYVCQILCRLDKKQYFCDFRGPIIRIGLFLPLLNVAYAFDCDPSYANGGIIEIAAGLSIAQSGSHVYISIPCV